MDEETIKAINDQLRPQIDAYVVLSVKNAIENERLRIAYFVSTLQGYQTVEVIAKKIRDMP